MIRVLALLVFAGMATACGGSSGGGGAPGGGTPPRDSQTIAADILSGCAAQTLDEWTTLLDALQGIGADGATQTPAARLDGFVLIPSPGVNWVFDIDGDGTDDGTGQTTFPGAGPTFFLLFAGLAAGTVTNEQFLAQIPDGTVVRTSFDIDQAYMTTGVLTTTLSNPGDGSPAVPATTDGDITFAQQSCEVQYQWLDVALDDLAVPAGQYPSAELSMDVRSDDGDLEGDLTFDGTSEALLATQLLPDGDANDFLIDLTTGEVMAQ